MRKADKTGVYRDTYYKNFIKNQNNSPASFNPTFKRLNNYLPVTGPICDIGSGIGMFLKSCEEHGLKAVGIEGSKAACDYANKFTNNRTLLHNIENKLPFKANCFQVVHCNQVLEHLKPEIAEKLIAEAHRILKSKGLFVCSCPNYYDFSERVPEHINLYTPTRLRKTLIKHCYRILFEHYSLNLSILTPWEKPAKANSGKVRRFVKKYSALINIILSPFWIPLRFINSKFINAENIDIFSGTCYFISQKQ